MFGPAHLIFMLISILLIAAGLWAVHRYRPPLDRLLRLCLLLGLLSEAVKVLSVIQIVPVVEPAVEGGVLVYRETGAYAPYLQAEHLPFELCSFQIVFMFLALVLKDPVWKRRICAAIYGTAIPGGVMAIVLASIAPDFATAGEFFAAPRAWQFFLYHSMIVVLGAAVGMDRQLDLRFRDVRSLLLILLALDCASFYVNSMMSVPYYRGDELAGMGYAVNYFSSYSNPLGITVSTKPQYLLYLLIRLSVALAAVFLVFLPLRRREKGQAQG